MRVTWWLVRFIASVALVALYVSAILVLAAARDIHFGRASLGAGASWGGKYAAARVSEGQSEFNTARIWAMAGIGLGIVPAALVVRRRRIATKSDIVRMAGSYARHHPGWWYRPFHVVLSSMGWILLGSGIITAGVAQRTHKGEFLTILAVALGGVAIALVGGMVLAYSRPRSAKDAVQTLYADDRAPVLYLRSFADDASGARVEGVLSPGVFAAADIESREELLVTVLKAFGPVITVARPHEKVPRLGAARFYLRPDEWQSAVAKIMDLAGLVVIRLGDGAGLWWEFAHAVRHLAAQRLVVLIPQPPPARIMQTIEGHLPRSSGLTPSAVASGGDGWTSTIICFDFHGRAVATPVSSHNGYKNQPGQWIAGSLQASLAAVGVRQRWLHTRIAQSQLAKLGRLVLCVPAVVLLFDFGALVISW